MGLWPSAHPGVDATEGLIHNNRAMVARSKKEVEILGPGVKGSNVVTGVFLSKIPEPDYPLGTFGRRKYDEFTRMLYDGGKLTLVSVARASVAARFAEKLHVMALEGKYPTASDMTQLQRALDSLGIAEDAPPIASPGKTNKFAHSGFALRRKA